jgi:glycosyltransferase involved in cell wall biosynthesis
VKVIIATPYFHPRTGGLETYAWHLAHGLRAAGVQAVVVCGDSVRTVQRDEVDGLIVYRLPIWRTVSNTPINPWWPWMLRRIFRVERPDVINAHTPVVFMVDMVALAVGRRPFVVTYHASSLLKADSLPVRAVAHAYLMVQGLTLGRADAIAAVSPHVRSVLGRWRDKTSVVSNAVAAVAPPVEIAGTGLIFLASLQRTHSWKGLDLVLDALARYADRYGEAPRLTVLGDGDDRPRYEARADELGLRGSVHFAGHICGPDRDQLLRGARALVAYPTTANDAFPTVLLESWAQGVPVIAAAIGALLSLVDDGHTGLLARANDPTDLVRALHELLIDPSRAQVLGENGRCRVRAEFTWTTQIARMMDLLENVTADHRRRN